MRTDFTASLNSVNLHEIDTSIYIEDIYEEPKIGVNTESRATYGLSLLNEPEREQLEITIRLMVKKGNRVDRQAIISKILGWAKSGWLQTNLRSGQKIYVACTQKPQYKSYKPYESFEIKFTAYNEAYWQETTPVNVTLTGTTGSCTIKPNGTHRCFLEAEVTNTSGSTVTSVTLQAGTKSITFSGLTLANNGVLKLFYDEMHILRAEISGTSVMNTRTEASDDEIPLVNGSNNTVSFSASGACSVKFIARGLYE